MANEIGELTQTYGDEGAIIRDMNIDGVKCSVITDPELGTVVAKGYDDNNMAKMSIGRNTEGNFTRVNLADGRSFAQQGNSWLNLDNNTVATADDIKAINEAIKECEEVERTITAAKPRTVIKDGITTHYQEDGTTVDYVADNNGNSLHTNAIGAEHLVLGAESGMNGANVPLYYDGPRKGQPQGIEADGLIAANPYGNTLVVSNQSKYEARSYGDEGRFGIEVGGPSQRIFYNTKGEISHVRIADEKLRVIYRNGVADEVRGEHGKKLHGKAKKEAIAKADELVAGADDFKKKYLKHREGFTNAFTYLKEHKNIYETLSSARTASTNAATERGTKDDHDNATDAASTKKQLHVDREKMELAIKLVPTYLQEALRKMELLDEGKWMNSSQLSKLLLGDGKAFADFEKKVAAQGKTEELNNYLKHPIPVKRGRGGGRE